MKKEKRKNLDKVRKAAELLRGRGLTNEQIAYELNSQNMATQRGKEFNRVNVAYYAPKTAVRGPYKKKVNVNHCWKPWIASTILFLIGLSVLLTFIASDVTH